MSSSEEEHTLNQCMQITWWFSFENLHESIVLVLVEMDGLESKSNVIMLASTNRADVLDKVCYYIIISNGNHLFNSFRHYFDQVDSIDISLLTFRHYPNVLKS